MKELRKVAGELWEEWRGALGWVAVWGLIVFLMVGAAVLLDPWRR